MSVPSAPNVLSSEAAMTENVEKNMATTSQYSVANSPTMRKQKLQDFLFHKITFSFALFVLVVFIEI